jgi:hypothetical protein
MAYGPRFGLADSAAKWIPDAALAQLIRSIVGCDGGTDTGTCRLEDWAGKSSSDEIDREGAPQTSVGPVSAEREQAEDGGSKAVANKRITYTEFHQSDQNNGPKTKALTIYRHLAGNRSDNLIQKETRAGTIATAFEPV